MQAATSSAASSRSTASARKGFTTMVSCFMLYFFTTKAQRTRSMTQRHTKGLRSFSAFLCGSFVSFVTWGDSEPSSRDRQRLPCDIAAFLASQEEDGVGDV